MRGDDNYIPVAKFPKPKTVEQKECSNFLEK